MPSLNKMLFRLIILIILLSLTACSTFSIEPTFELNSQVTPPENISVWTPSSRMRFQVQFSGVIDLSAAADIFDLDAFDTDSTTIEALHQENKFVICYINAGTVEDWRPDASQYPSELVGKEYQGWPGEKWLDIRNLERLAPIIEARMDLCRSKGFDGVEFDNVDGYQNDTGFDLTASDQLTFNRWLADTAHQYGLAVGLKNDPDQIKELEPWFDFLILESCFEQGWCGEAKPFVDAGKPVFAIEYLEIDDHCTEARNSGITLLQKHRELDAWRKACH